MVCIQNSQLEKELTLDKVYYDNLMGISESYCDIINDEGIQEFYSKERFQTLQDIRQDKLQSLANDI